MTTPCRSPALRLASSPAGRPARAGGLISCPLRQGSGSWGINRTARKDTALLLADALGQTEPVRAVFVAAVRGRVPAAEVLTAMPGQARAASPTAAGGVHGFPPVLTSFVGRAGAVSEVAALLDQYRLVTGPGGAGKTRLAGVVAERVAGRFADGVWLAELAAVLDPAAVAPAVATALGVREQAGGPAANALARVLARQQLLLVLDNRLDDRFALLTAGDRLAPGRQRSLAATVAWSYQLLDDQERRVFLAVSVFPAGFTLEAAEAVAGDGAGAAVLRLVDCCWPVPGSKTRPPPP